MRKLLVADDTDDILMLLRITLGRSFDIVAEATDGAEALDLWREHRDVVFALVLDYRMPRMSGLDVARRVLEDAPDTRIVLFSANLDDDLRQEAMDAGVTAVVEKDGLARLASHPALTA